MAKGCLWIVGAFLLLVVVAAMGEGGGIGGAFSTVGIVLLLPLFVVGLWIALAWWSRK